MPPLLPYAALAEQLDLYRAKCAEHGNEPDIVWIHACYIDEDREVAKREAEKWMVGFLKGNASPLTEYDPPPADELNAAGYGFYTAGILEKLAQTPYDAMIDGDIVWVGTPADVIERIEAVKELCAGLTEISITVNAGGAEHWQAIKAQELFAQTVMPHFKAGAAGGGGRGLVSIERVCVVGGGVIGSLYAAHLSRVADVWVLTRRPEHARALEAQGLEVTRPRRVHRPRPRDRRPGRAAGRRRRDRRDEGTGRRRGRRRARRPLPRRDGRHRPERARRRADRPQARGLAARLRRHLHERHAARRHARRVHPRHRDVARPVQRHPVRAGSRSSPT